jgi:hypothetical protein
MGLGSGKNLFRIPDPEVKKAPDPGSGFATLTVGTFLVTIPIRQINFKLDILFRRVHEGKQLKEECQFCGKQVFNIGTLRLLINIRCSFSGLITDCNVADHWHFGTDPDPWIRTSG